MKLVAIDDEDTAVLRANTRAITADGARDALGISWDTWSTIEKGHPVSLRTRDRLSRVLETPVNVHCSANDDPVELSVPISTFPGYSTAHPKDVRFAASGVSKACQN